MFGYKFVAVNHRNVRCLMLLNCFHARTMLEIESRRVFCFDVGDNCESGVKVGEDIQSGNLNCGRLFYANVADTPERRVNPKFRNSGARCGSHKWQLQDRKLRGTQRRKRPQSKSQWRRKHGQISLWLCYNRLSQIRSKKIVREKTTRKNDRKENERDRRENKNDSKFGRKQSGRNYHSFRAGLMK